MPWPVDIELTTLGNGVDAVLWIHPMKNSNRVLEEYLKRNSY